MIRHLKLIVCLSLALATVAAGAQVSPAPSNSAVAYVYVSSTNNSSNDIVAFAAAANGKLSTVNGSPFPDNVSSMAVNGKYLMAANAAKPDIDTSKIESDGALTYASSINYQKYDYGCGYAGPLFFDHTGATVYLMEYDGSSACANTVYASYAVAPATGNLDNQLLLAGPVMRPVIGDDNLFDEVFDRDQACDAAVLIDHNCHANVILLHLAKKVAAKFVKLRQERQSAGGAPSGTGHGTPGGATGQSNGEGAAPGDQNRSGTAADEASTKEPAARLLKWIASNSGGKRRPSR